MSAASGTSAEQSHYSVQLHQLLCLPDEIVLDVLNQLGIGDFVRLQIALVKNSNRIALTNLSSRLTVHCDPGYLWDGRSLKGLSALGVKISSVTLHPSLTETDVMDAKELFRHVRHVSYEKCSVLNLNILRYCPSIQSLSVCITHVPTVEAMMELAASAPNLHSLRLAYVRGVPQEDIAAIAKIFPLEHLDPSRTSLSFDSVATWAPHCTRLKSVSFHGSSVVNVESVRIVCRSCTSLQSLDLGSISWGLSGYIIASIVPMCTTLTTLCINNSNCLSDASLLAIAENLPYLTDLSIGESQHRTSPALPWTTLFSQCTKLRKLTVVGTDVPNFMESLLQCDLKLTHLSLPGCCSEEGMYCIAQQFSGLLGLQLCGGAVTDLVLAGIAGGCPMLEELNIARSKHFSVDAFVMLTRSCRKLRTVNLRRCTQLNDYAISSLAKNCRELVRLDLCGVVLLTDGSLFALAQNCRNLRSLDVGLCANVTVEGVEAILRGCRRLAVLEVYGCETAAQMQAFRSMQNTRWAWID